MFLLHHAPRKAALDPQRIEQTPLPSNSWREVRFAVAGVRVSIIEGVGEVEIIVEGVLPEPVADQLAEEIRANVQQACGKPCFIKPACACPIRPSGR